MGTKKPCQQDADAAFDYYIECGGMITSPLRLTSVMLPLLSYVYLRASVVVPFTLLVNSPTILVRQNLSPKVTVKYLWL